MKIILHYEVEHDENSTAIESKIFNSVNSALNFIFNDVYRKLYLLSIIQNLL